MLIVFMGVTGAGKTTIGRQFAAKMGVVFYDGDDFHSPSMVAKMRDGRPLTDADREPWLERLAMLIQQIGTEKRSAVLACSALKAAYRARLRAAAEGAGLQITLVHLVVTPEVALARLRERRGHFMPASLVESQFETIEHPHEAMAVDASIEPELLVEQIRKALEIRPGPT